MVEYSAGIVTAYGAAVRGGYKGTYEEFCRQQAQYADNAEAVEQAKQTAVSNAQVAYSAAQTAGQANTQAQAASTAAQSASQLAGQSAQDAQTAESNASTHAQNAASAAGSAQASAAAAQAVKDSIPSDYTELSSDVDQLKADLDNVNDVFDIQKNLTKFGESDLSVTWESGRISGVGGDYPDTYSIRSVGYVVGIAGTTLSVSCNVAGLTRDAFLKIERYTEAGVYDSEGAVRIRATEMPATVAVASGYKYRIVWRMSDNSRTPLGSDISITVKSEIEYMPAIVKTVTDGLQLRLSALEEDISYVFNGESNTPVRYDMDQIKPCHVSFDFQWTSYPEFYASAIYVPLCSIYGNMLKAAYSPRTLMFDSAIYRRCLIAAIDASNSIDSSNYVCNISENEPFLGNPSFWIRYTGLVDSNTDVECVCTDSSITFRHSGNSQEIATVTFALTDTVDSLIAAINALTDFEASGIETAGKTCADLSIIKGITFPMHTNVTVSGVTTYDAPKINIPLLYNTAWHTCEIICDPNNNVAYVAIDGRTLQSTLKPLLHDGNKYIEIGGNYNNTGMPFKVRNIVINHGNFGDAEVVQSYVWPYESSKVQIVSSKNPKLLLFEGHGITVGTDSDAPHVVDDDELSTSTDRLNTVFSALKAKGYMPVTWEQIIDWKINGTSLPKRCYNIMMDDVRLENYVNYDKRIPFNKHNVMAGLAFITGSYGLSDTVTIDGTTYTYADMIRIVNRAGWYITSHTANHTKLNELTPTAIDAELKASALSCDSVDVHSDLIIYPGGRYSNAMLSSLQRSVFKCGVGVAVDGYNCKMTNRYRLCRVEIGIRASLANVLSQIV